ncbi:hemolysin family protein [Halocynthiibacter namhaensis]|uniref:hemolysin family protein n=1 Tax=Halocynthiibacter namhaensis TaxID=1290553 RepID=UPI0005795793|nr:hemolysin family protein [Halocynthiibacter namhaensis]
MGDTIEGSSIAAQRAQEDDEPGQNGFFRKLLANFSQPNDTAPAVEEPIGAVTDVSAAHGMLNLRRMRLEDVAIPRVEIISVSDDISKDELVEVFRESGLSRLPVFSGTLDKPAGMIHLKDFSLKHGFNGPSKNGEFSFEKLMRPLLFAPPSMPIGILLQKMQTERIHMALVIDEYGGVDGLVTIEDLIEQVIGEIEDEHDAVEGQLWFEEKPGCYVAEARAPLDEFEAAIGLNLSAELDDEDVDTLGGLVFVLLGHVPGRGEMIRHPAGPDFEVIDADPRRIKRVRVHLPMKKA